MSDISSPEKVGVLITELGEAVVAEDGRTAMLAMRTAAGQDVVLAFSLQLLTTWREKILVLFESAGRRSMPVGQPFLRFPKSFEIGHAEEDQMRNMVALRFEPDTPNDATYMLHNADGLKVAKMLKADIMPRLTDAERIKAVMEEARIEPPPRGRLILPPGHG